MTTVRSITKLRIVRIARILSVFMIIQIKMFCLEQAYQATSASSSPLPSGRWITAPAGA